jgi:hypothetical protein
MRRTTLVCTLSALGMGLVLGANAFADPGGKGKGHDKDSLRIHLKGFEEVPIVVTGATGSLELDINEAAQSIAYELTYSGLEGTVTQAHIHLAQKNVNGGIVLWLCQGTSRAPAPVAATTPECPQSGTAAGTLTPASVIVPAAPNTQGIGQGTGPSAWDDVLRAIRAGRAYANVHSSIAAGGEIRGQLD